MTISVRWPVAAAGKCLAGMNRHMGSDLIDAGSLLELPDQNRVLATLFWDILGIIFRMFQIFRC
jgi:hypothetical protein